jgi:hypothetical protein
VLDIAVSLNCLRVSRGGGDSQSRDRQYYLGKFEF